MSNVKALVHFAIKRHALYVKRMSGRPPPWTNDSILQQYRFCNVYRELDRVTQFIRGKYTGSNSYLWFDLVVARLLNNPASLELLPSYSDIGWKPDAFLRTLQKRQVAGHRVFNAAYIVSTNGHAMDKLEYLVEKVLNPMWKHRIRMEQEWKSIQVFHSELMQFQGMGSFMAGQVVADVKNTKGQLLADAKDWWAWAAKGPGSQRGLSRVLFGQVGHSFGQTRFVEELGPVQQDLNAAFKRLEWQPLCAQDVQNCLCEFDKYERTRLGEGVPKQLFRPAAA